MDETDFPLIGPHEGRELELMLAGKKRVAYFAECEPYEAFRPYVENGRIVRREWKDQWERVRQMFVLRGIEAEAPMPVLYGLAGYEDQIDRLQAALDASMTVRGEALIAVEYEIGRLLGYPEAAIEAYVARLRERLGL